MITRTSRCNEEHAIGPYTGSFTRIAHATNICICNPRPNRGQRTVGNATLLSVQLQERNYNTLYPVLSNLLLSVPPRPFYVFHCVAVGRRGERGDGALRRRRSVHSPPPRSPCTTTNDNKTSRTQITSLSVRYSVCLSLEHVVYDM